MLRDGCRKGSKVELAGMRPGYEPADLLALYGASVSVGTPTVRAMSNPKLTVELVPRGQWGANLRAQLTRAQWNRCKKYAKERSGGVCAVCGGVGSRYPVECHEQWEYDESGPARVQRLVGLIALCPSCHLVKHYGRAQARGFRREALEQLMAVNAWTVEQAEAHVAEAGRVWFERSRHDWELDLTWLSVVLPHWSEEWEDTDPENPFFPGTQEYEEHELYMQMLADRD